MDRCDTSCESVMSRRESHRVAIKQQGALRWLQDARHDLDERRFPCAVLANKSNSPGYRSKLTPLSARTPGKRLLMFESAKHGSRVGRAGCVTAASRRRCQAARLLKTDPVATGKPLFAHNATTFVCPTSSPRRQRGVWLQSNQNCAAYFSMFDLSKTRRLFRNVLFSASIVISPRRPILTVLPTSGFR
jgi:hypothetical protein